MALRPGASSLTAVSDRTGISHQTWGSSTWVLLGVLDIGSNSAQLQVVEVRAGAPPLPTHAVKEPALLGEAFGPDGAIDIAGVDRVVEAVQRALDAARRLGVEQLYVFATAAVRDATNRDLILARVEREQECGPNA